MEPSTATPLPLTQTVLVHGRPFLWREGEGLDPSACIAITGYIQRLARKYERQAMRCGHSREDLFQAGMVGALVSARSYDPREGARFLTWAHWRVLKEMSDLLGQPELHISERQMAALKADGAIPRMTSLSAPTALGSELGTLLPAESADPIETIAAMDARATLHRLLRGLTAKEREILARRIAGQTLDEIGQTLGVSRQRVQQIESGAVARMRALVRRSR